MDPSKIVPSLRVLCRSDPSGIEGLTEPALVLTPVDQTDSFDDGLLTTSEITRFTLNARLIVLSACNTAKIDTNAASLGATDLQAAFSVAGAPTLVAALWTVETATARDIVTAFFNIWQKQTNKSASLALASATRNYLQAADRAHQHPRFWAPLVVLGYGYATELNPRIDGRDIVQFDALANNSAGEIIDARVFQDKLVTSMQSDWNGEKLASIIGSPNNASDLPILKTYEIGAGHLIATDAALYALGYKTSDSSYPILRKIDRDGRLIWEKHFEHLANHSFVDGRYVEGAIFLLAETRGSTNDPQRNILILKLDLDGTKLAERVVRVPHANLLIGKTAMFANLRDGVAIAVNSQLPSALDFDPTKIGPLGLAPWCQGAMQSTLYSLDIGSLAVSRLATMDDYQVSKIDRVGSRIFIAGQERRPCSDVGVASLLELMTNSSLRPVWKDDDPFPSSVQSFTESAANIAILIRRQRPLGIRTFGSKQVAVESKRWGDDGVELWEFSILKIDPNGKTVGVYDSTFGISSYVQGIIQWHNRLVIFGGLGGRPAISPISEIGNSR